MKVLVDNRVRVPLAGLSSQAAAELKARFTHDNPQHFKLKKMGFPAWGEPPKIRTFKEEGDFLTFPRGGVAVVEQILGTTAAFERHVTSGKPGKLSAHLLTLRAYQEEAREAALREEQGVIKAPTGCHAKGQLILMWDGTTKRVEDVTLGDKLMGPDRTPRFVLELRRGRGELAKIVPVKGEPFIVNEGHVLTLQRVREGRTPKKCAARAGELIDVTVEEWRRWSNRKKHIHKLVRTGAIEFASCVRLLDLPLDPYVYGAFLGDGWMYTNGSISLASNDYEVVEAVALVAAAYGISGSSNDRTTWRWTSARGRPASTLKLILRALGFEDCRAADKKVHPMYLRAPLAARLELLAGLMDTDGSLASGNYDFVSKSPDLAQDVAWLARSVGLAAYVSPCTKVCTNSKTKARGIYYRVQLSGDVAIVPCRIPRKKAKPRLQKKSVLRTGFSAELLGEGDYYGFSLDGDGRYVLGDFTITHNSGKTSIAFAFAAAVQVPVLVMVHTSGLFEQWIERAGTELGMPARDVGMIRGKQRKLRTLTIAMQQTMNRFTEEDWELVLPYFGAVVQDEVHHAPAVTAFDIVDRFPARYRLGISADHTRADKKDFLTLDLYGGVIFSVSAAELVEEGFIHVVEARMVPTSFKADWYRAMRARGESPDFSRLVNEMCADEARTNQAAQLIAAEVHQGARCLVFSGRTEQCREISARLTWLGVKSGLMLGGPEWADEFERSRLAIKAGTLHVGIGTPQAIGEGIDLPAVERGFLLTPVQTRQPFNQIRGRLCRPAEGKENAAIYYLADVEVFGASVVRRVFSWVRDARVLVGTEWVEARAWLAAKEAEEDGRSAGRFG